jgi:hypothetical protein
MITGRAAINAPAGGAPEHESATRPCCKRRASIAISIAISDGDWAGPCARCAAISAACLGVSTTRR